MICKLQKSKSTEDISSEIVVIHAKGVPKLHGILKQRTVSESSDDCMRTSGFDPQPSTTTASEGDDDGSPDRSSVGGGQRILKKSVSFNDHIDRTLFQANQSVSSMHSALKNRRRRARKRDQKQEQREQRRRRRSSGSFSLEESGDEQTTGVQVSHVNAEKDGQNSHSSTEFGTETNDCCSLLHASSDEANCSYSNTICDGTEIYTEEACSSQDVLSCESCSINGDVDENEKPIQSELLQYSKVTLNDTGNATYSNKLRTKSSLVESGSDTVSGGVNTTNVCDNTLSVDVFGNDENCELEMSRINVVICANDVLVADDNISQLAVSCIPDSALELPESCQTNDTTASVAECKSQFSQKKAILKMGCLFDLDVD